MTPVPGARSVFGVVRYADVAAGQADLERACERLTTLYRPVLGDGARARSLWLPGLATGVVVVDAEGDAAALQTPLVWGTAVADAGLAGPETITAALRAPESVARYLLGVFVLLGADTERLRLVSSSSLVHTLKRVDGAVAIALATRGLAAHVLADKQPVLHEEAIAEHVVLDYPLGEDELLRDTRVLPDAAVVDIDRDGVHERSYWPLEERIQPGSPTSADDLRGHIARDVVTVSRIPRVHLGLTAGRDSILLAQCLADAGGRIPTFTLGRRGYDDPAGARAVARQLGWTHDVVPSSLRWTSPWSRMAELSVWTEGMQSGTALLQPTYHWSERDVVWLGGNGAEIARGFYWARQGDPAAWLADFRTGLLERFPTQTGATTVRRLDATLDGLAALGRPKDDLLDVFYATGRMAKWLCRDLPTPQFWDVVPGYLSPPMVRALLDVPLDDRRSGRPFAELLAARDPGLHALAAGRAGRRFHPSNLHGPTRQQVVRRIRDLLQRLPGESVTRRLLGDNWLDDILERAPRAQWATRQAWNVVSVEAFGLALAQLE